jgi:hypothetical protein
MQRIQERVERLLFLLAATDYALNGQEQVVKEHRLVMILSYY